MWPTVYKRHKSKWGRCCSNLHWKKLGRRVSVHSVELLILFGEDGWYYFNQGKGIVRWF